MEHCVRASCLEFATVNMQWLKLDDTMLYGPERSACEFIILQDAFGKHCQTYIIQAQTGNAHVSYVPIRADISDYWQYLVPISSTHYVTAK